MKSSSWQTRNSCWIKCSDDNFPSALVEERFSLDRKRLYLLKNLKYLPLQRAQLCSSNRSKMKITFQLLRPPQLQSR